jgi:hypothetical protein
LVGIFRETLHSPERVFDDFEILRLTGEALRSNGVEVHLAKPERAASLVSEWTEPPPEVVFLMCEQERILARLCDWEVLGTVLVNSLQGIRNTYRHRMIPLLSPGGVPIPKSELVRTSEPLEAAGLRLSFLERKPLWVKRGDVHNIRPGDVMMASSWEEVLGQLKILRSRGVSHAVLQEHVNGDLVKLYGIGQSTEAWFRWFYHRDQKLMRYGFSEEALRDAFFAAGKILGLEIFGGDAVVGRDGSIHIIDINAWPSFALFRAEASQAIARHILSKLLDPVPAE